MEARFAKSGQARDVVLEILKAICPENPSPIDHVFLGWRASRSEIFEAMGL